MDILVAKDGRPSMLGVYGHMKNKNARLIVRRRLQNGREWYRTYINNDNTKRIKKKIPGFVLSNVIIRWGNRIEINTEGKIVYNSATAIARATDKKESRRIFMEKGVRCPRLVGRDNNVFPVIARPSRHAKGKNFVVLKNRAEFLRHYDANERNGWYYSEFIDKNQEFRVHCAHGKVIEIMEKPRGEGIAWNRARVGEPFVRVPRNNYDDKLALCVEALKATQALGLDFSGVDVIVKDGVPYVVECNTSQTLNSSPHVTERYAKYFDWLARSEQKRPHWDFLQFKKAKSLVWKNFQFNETAPGANEVDEE